MIDIFNPEDLKALVRTLTHSLILMLAVFIVLWFPLYMCTLTLHPEAAKYRMHGGSIKTSKLERYDQAKETIIYVSVTLSLVLSQSAIWMVVVSKQKSEGTERVTQVLESES